MMKNRDAGIKEQTPKSEKLPRSPKVINYIKAQRLQWFGYVMRRDEAKARWLYGVKQGLRTIDVEDWRETVQDRDKWKAVTVAVKTLGEP
ncbi:Hypothetical protein CINCED_3A012988 [Cinara cedri]|uniref:Uncharacterized protein n=1 Tax=Cinara cedri TaxID=506608 RepID=A0A5E4NR32_9HEMI|nr:Hypothetical protein CINCED_3A012988 [Cinara cedri]